MFGFVVVGERVEVYVYVVVVSCVDGLGIGFEV